MRHAAPQEDLDDRLGLRLGRRLDRLGRGRRAAPPRRVGQQQSRRAAQAAAQRLAAGDPRGVLRIIGSVLMFILRYPRVRPVKYEMGLRIKRLVSQQSSLLAVNVDKGIPRC